MASKSESWSDMLYSSVFNIMPDQTKQIKPFKILVFKQDWVWEDFGVEKM